MLVSGNFDFDSTTAHQWHHCTHKIALFFPHCLRRERSRFLIREVCPLACALPSDAYTTLSQQSFNLSMLKLVALPRRDRKTTPARPRLWSKLLGYPTPQSPIKKIKSYKPTLNKA